MTFKELAEELCFREGKTEQVNVAQMREILKCLRQLIAERPIEVLRALLK